MKTDYILRAAEKYKISKFYNVPCDHCLQKNGEPHYIIEGVFICEPCLLENWEEFDDIQAEAMYLEEEAERVDDPEGDAIDRAYDEKTN